VGVVVLNASLNVIDRLVSEVQSLDAVSALISIRFLQLFRGCPQMLERCLHVGLVLGVEVSRSQQNQRKCEHYSDMGYVSSHALSCWDDGRKLVKAEVCCQPNTNT
jgi:hypothetical protein